MNRQYQYFIMGGLHSVPKIGFEDIMDTVLKNSHAFALLNTLPPTEQDCLIVGTLSAFSEESVMNQLISSNKAHYIVVYGRNATDPTLIKKYEQLTKFGFVNVHVYLGGMFEWLLLQEVYGTETFPTTSNCKDLYKYRSAKTLGIAGGATTPLLL
jgi:hypothetical protein